MLKSKLQNKIFVNFFMIKYLMYFSLDFNDKNTYKSCAV